jgi:hypothetical protein
VDEAAISVLVRVLWEEGPARVKAAEVLGRMGPAARSAVPALTNLLKGSDTEARIQAAQALWRIDRRVDEAVPVLVGALKSFTPRQGNILNVVGHSGVRSGALPGPPCQQAAEALAEMGSSARGAVPALLEVLHASQLFPCRPQYALALWKIDHLAARAAVPPLIEVLEGKGRAGYSKQAASSLRKHTASVLGQIAEQAPDAIPALAKALADADPGVRQEAAKALGGLGVQAGEAVPHLRKALGDPDEAVRSQATAALKKIGA